MTALDIDPYAVLNLLPSASPDEIRSAYRRLAATCHPDLQPPDKKAWAQEQMIRLNAARDLLLNPRRRVQYHREHADQLRWQTEQARWRQNPEAARAAYAAPQARPYRQQPFRPISLLILVMLCLLSLVTLPFLWTLAQNPTLATQFQRLVVQQFMAGLALLGGIMLMALQVLLITVFLALLFYGLSQGWRR